MPRRLIVVAPHPDDETIGAYALMCRLRRRGVAVKVVVLTDGAASHPNSLRWPRRRLTAERRRESRRVLRQIGVAANDVTFLNLPDGCLHRHTVPARRGLARALGHGGPALVAVSAASDAHPDHRSAAICASTLRRPGLRVLAYPVWPAGSRPAGARALLLTAQERLAKRHAVRRYRTQAGRITDDPQGFVMTPAQIATFTRPCELFLDGRR